jgi:hypothetical protein
MAEIAGKAVNVEAHWLRAAASGDGVPHSYLQSMGETSRLCRTHPITAGGG